MLNQVILVGRITKIEKIKELENGTKVAYVTIAIPRSYKNAEGVYETDFARCELWQRVAEATCEYCQVGDLIGIKGYLKSIGTNHKMIIVADKVTYLSTRKEDKGE